MKFSDIIGHKSTILSLRDSVDKDKIPHAILISGISGIGKFSLARALAQYIHCHNRQNGDSCGECPSCKQHRNLNNPDLNFIFPVVKRDGAQLSKDYLENWKEMLDKHPLMNIKNWNDLIKAGNSQPAIYVHDSDWMNSRASLSSYQENYKIFIIWLPERMRPEAANKILKLIEEPFHDTIFILVSDEESKILPTIYSRTQRFHLNPLSEDEITCHLLNKGLDLTASKEIARISEGNLSIAESFVNQSEELKEFSEIFKQIMRCCWKFDIKSLKDLAETTASFGREKNLRFLSFWSRKLRENFIFNFNLPELSLQTKEENDFSKNFAPFINEENIIELSEEVSKAYKDIERNGNAKIIMLDLLLITSGKIKKKLNN